MITIYFDDHSIEKKARYSVEDRDGRFVGMSGIESIDGQRSVEVDTRGQAATIFIIQGNGVVCCYDVEDGADVYAFTGRDYPGRLRAEMARLRKVELLARAIIMSGRDDLIGEFDDLAGLY